MYGYTPPTVIAIDPDMLSDLGGCQGVAAGIAAQLRHRPAWIVVKAPAALDEDERPAFAVESCLRVPDDDLPADVDDAMAEVLRRHLEDLGVLLTVQPLPQGPTPHSPSSALVAGTWRDAVDLARLAGADEVMAWTMEPEWVPEEVDGVPFTPQRPDAVAV